MSVGNSCPCGSRDRQRCCEEYSSGSNKLTKGELLNKISALLQQYEEENHNQPGGCILGASISFPEDRAPEYYDCSCENMGLYTWGGDDFLPPTKK